MKLENLLVKGALYYMGAIGWVALIVATIATVTFMLPVKVYEALCKHKDIVQLVILALIFAFLYFFLTITLQQP